MPSRWIAILAGCAVMLAILLQIPNILRESDPRYRGVPIPLNSDEFIYWARVQESLDGRPEQSGEAIIGDPALAGAQPSLLESATGTIFRWTGLKAAKLLEWMDSVIPPLLFLTMWMFLRLSGFTRMEALAGALLFCVLELYNLSRPLYQRTSFLVTLLAFCAVIRGTKGKMLPAIIGGLLLGLLVGIYFWAWTFGWLFWGIFLVWEGVEWFRHRKSAFKHLLLSGFAGGIAALPFLVSMFKASRSPAYADAVFRSGIHPSHLPESWIYGAIFLCIGVSLLILLLKRPTIARRYQPAIVFALAGAVAANQQMIHGRVFMFVSHYLLALIFGAIIVVLLALRFAKDKLQWKWFRIPALAALLYLSGIAWDGRHVVKQFTVNQSNFDAQYLAEAVETLDRLPRGRILASPDTSLFIAGLTHHDVVYAMYLKNVLITNVEMAERYCATQLPVAPEQRHIAEREYLIWPDANSGYHHDPVIRQKEVEIVEAACKRIDLDPPNAFTRFGVDYVFWNEKEEPKWDLKRLKVPLKKLGSGSGWSLWAE